jgi:hypothetical protein
MKNESMMNQTQPMFGGKLMWVFHIFLHTFPNFIFSDCLEWT